MPDRIPYSRKKRGRPVGSKNSPGHCAGRPSNGNGRKLVKEPENKAGFISGHNPITKLAIQPIVPMTNKSSLPIRAKEPPPKEKSVRIAYMEPSPKCADGHNYPPVLDITLPSNGNGEKKPVPSIPNSIAKSVIQSRLNEELITPEQIIKEVTKIATSDIRKLPGCPKGIPDDIAGAIASFEITRTTTKDGAVIERTRYNLWSKNSAHDQLMKWAGLYSKDNSQSKPEVNIQQNIQVNQVDLKDFSKEELLTLYKLGVLKNQNNEELFLLPEKSSCR
jgi:hypothetical protein